MLTGGATTEELHFDADNWLMVEVAALCRAAALNLIGQEIEFYQEYRHADVAGWYETLRDGLKGMRGQQFVLPIGWGSGYDAKTVTDLLGDEVFGYVASQYRNTKGLGHPGNSAASEWLGPALSPKSRKLVVRRDAQGKEVLVPVGWVAVNLKSLDAPSDDWQALSAEAQAKIEGAATPIGGYSSGDGDITRAKAGVANAGTNTAQAASGRDGCAQIASRGRNQRGDPKIHGVYAAEIWRGKHRLMAPDDTKSPFGI